MADARPGGRLAELEARWRQEPKSTAFFPFAEELRRAGQLERAIEILEQGLALQPTYLAARVALGRNLLETGETVAAVEVLERALLQDPTQLVARKLLIEAHLRLGNRESAREHLGNYRLLVGRDRELDLLEARVSEQAPADIGLSLPVAPPPAPPQGEIEEPERPGEIFELGAPASSRFEFAFAPDPRRRAREVEPFGKLLVPPGLLARWRNSSRLERLFPVAESVLSDQLPGTSLEMVARVEAPPVEPGEAVRSFSASSLGLESVGEPAVDFAQSTQLSEADATVEELFEQEGAVETAAAGPARPFFELQEIGRDVERELLGLEPAVAEAVPEASEVEAASAGDRAPSLEEAIGIEAVADAEAEVADVPPAEPAAGRPSWVVGKLLLEQGHLQEAEQEFQRVLAERPDHAEARAGLEEVAARREQLASGPGPVPPATGALRLRSSEQRLRVLRSYLNRIRRSRELSRVS